MCGGGLLLAARQAGRTRDAVRHENTAGKGEQHGEREERREAAHRGPQTEGSEFVRASEHGGGRVGSMCAAVRVHARRIANRERTDESDTVATGLVLRSASGCSGPLQSGANDGTRTSQVDAQVPGLRVRGGRQRRILRGSKGSGTARGYLPCLPQSQELRCGSPKRPHGSWSAPHGKLCRRPAPAARHSQRSS